jgi:hypothetical protein
MRRGQWSEQVAEHGVERRRRPLIIARSGMIAAIVSGPRIAHRPSGLGSSEQDSPLDMRINL